LGTCNSLDETFDGHCVTLAGYEDDARCPGGGAFLIRNTWGAGWMQDGFARMSYEGWMQDGFARMSYEALQRYTNDALSFAVVANAPDGMLPTGQPLSNLTTNPVLDLRSAACVADSKRILTDDDNIARYGKAHWQNDNQLFFRSSMGGLGFSTALKVDKTATYTLSVAATKAMDYGTYAFLLDGKRIGQPYDFCWPSVEPTGEIMLGPVTLTEGVHTLLVECVGKAAVATGYFLGLDWVRLQPSLLQPH
jgi:hypothetical protein